MTMDASTLRPIALGAVAVAAIIAAALEKGDKAFGLWAIAFIAVMGMLP